MEDSNTEYPISILKVDFGCSKGCPADVRKMLQKIKGVKSVSTDPNQGKVRVVGNVNPTTLIKFFEEIGKKAELCSFEKEPKKSHSHSKHKHHSHSCCESSDYEDEFETDDSSDHRMHRTRHGQRSKRMHDHHERYGFGNEYTSPPPMNRYHHGPSMSGYHYQQPPLPGYHYHPHAHAPPMPLNQHAAYTYARPPPPPMYSRPMPMYGGYYGSGQPMRPTYGYYDSRMPRY